MEYTMKTPNRDMLKTPTVGKVSDRDIIKVP